MNKLFLLILLILPLVLISQKNFTSDIEKGSYSKVIKKSEKLLLKESENIESLYFIAVIKSRKSAGKHYNPLDAYHYAIKSQNLFNNVQDFKSLEFFNKIPISYNKFVEILDSIGVNAYSDIENSNLLAEFDFFLNTYVEVPKIYLDRAIIKKDHLVFEMAVSKNEVSALQDFIQENPNAIDRALAITLRDRLAFSNAKNDGKLHAFEKFIADYPNAFQVDSAYHFIHDLAFEEAKVKGNSNAFATYINKYPNSHLISQAIQKKDDLIFLEETDGSISKYLTFCKKYSQSNYYKVAFDSIIIQTIKFKNWEGAEYLLINKSRIHDESSFQENLINSFLFDGTLETCLNFENKFNKFLDQNHQSKLSNIKNSISTINKLYLKIGVNSNNSQDYENFITNLSPRSLAFVALQRLVEKGIIDKDYLNVIAILKKHEGLFNLNNTNKVTELIEILSEKLRQTQVLKVAKINTNNDEYAPVPSVDGKKIYFCGKNRSDNIGGEDIYVSLFNTNGFQNASVVSSLSTGSANEAPLSISADGNTMFLWNSENNGDIQYSTLKKDGSWSFPISLPDPINSEYYEGDAMLSADGNSFIFISSRPGGCNLFTDNKNSYYGDDNYPTDIYICNRLNGNNWSAPINLGENINTPFSERSPYLHPDGKTLYFSSEGHTGLGRMDVFKSTRQNDSTFNHWSTPQNLGKEINTTANDWGFKFATDGSHAFYSGSANTLQKSSLLLVLDISGSMAGTKLEALKIAAKDVCLNALENNTEIAIFAFEGDCYYPISDSIDFTIDPAELMAFIDGLYVNGSTPMYEALESGLHYLNQNASIESKSKSVILLSDGDATSCISLLELFNNIKRDKTMEKVYTIALEVSENSVAYLDLKAISSQTNGKFYHAESSAELGSVFAKATSAIFDFATKQSNSDIFKIQIPNDLRPEIVSTISGNILSSTKQPIEASIYWEDLSNGSQIGTAKSNPVDGSYFIALPTGKNYGYFVDHPDYFPTSNNIDLRTASSMQEIVLDINVVTYNEMLDNKKAVSINNIFFESGKFDLRIESYFELDRVLGVLKRIDFNGFKLEVSGHTDNIGGDQYNEDLSQKRSEAVANYLISKGMNPLSLVVKGYGSTKPLNDNSTENNRAKNRRVEIRILGKID